MLLLDIPLDLVTDVIATVVFTGKIEDILRLREVNTIFNAEATKYMSRHRLKNLLSLWTARANSGSMQESFGIRLALESFEINTDIQFEPKNTILAVTDHLTSQVENDDQPRNRIEVLKAALQVAQKYYGFRHLLKLLFRHVPTIKEPLNGRDRENDIELSSYLAGIALGCNDSWPPNLANNFDANVATTHFGSPMDVAICFGKCKLIKQLIRGMRRKRKWINRGDHLSRAVSHGRHDVVLLLLDPKYKLRTLGTVYGEAIHTAAGRGELDIVWTLIESHKNRERALRRRTLFWWAARWGWNDLLLEIMATGISPNDIRGMDVENYNTESTPLAVAAAEGHCSTVRLLLSHGAALKTFGKCAFAAAAAKGRFEVLELMLNQNRVCDINVSLAFSQAASAGRIDVFKYLLDLKLELPDNFRGPTNAFSAAIEANQLEMVRWLAEHLNLDMNNPSYREYMDNCPPLRDAIREGLPDMVDLLFQLGATPLDKSTIERYVISIQSYVGRVWRTKEELAKWNAMAIDVHNRLAGGLQLSKPVAQNEVESQAPSGL